MHRGMKLPLIVTSICIIDADIVQDEKYDWCKMFGGNVHSYSVEEEKRYSNFVPTV